jgi:hypothetical protein
LGIGGQAWILELISDEPLVVEKLEFSADSDPSVVPVDIHVTAEVIDALFGGFIAI